jgi:diguanylate cyclase (GGDEF)-like protein
MKNIYRLTWVDEKNLAHSVTLTPGNRKSEIGRSLTADIVVDNPSVSRIHAQLFWQKNVLNIRDLNSSFGTWVNGESLASQQSKTLYEKGEIRLGSLSIWFETHQKDESQELMQTCFFPPKENRAAQLPDELNALKSKILSNFKVYCEREEVPQALEELLHNELYTLCDRQREQLKTQRVLNSISHILNRCHTLEELSRSSLDLISKVLSGDRGFFMVYNVESKQFDLIAKRNFSEPDSTTFINTQTMYHNPLLELCLEKGEIIIIGDAQKDQTISSLSNFNLRDARSLVVLPLLQHDRIIGIIYVDSLTRSHCFSERHIPFLETFAAHTSIALHNAQLYRLAITDDLTGLYTRKFIDERLEQELERAKRYQRPFSVLILDLDHFKQINDTYGHITGDLVLKSTSKTLRLQLREADIAGRLGGEEFIVILGETSLKGAINFAERLREEIEQSIIRTDDQNIRVTASIGVAGYSPKYEDKLHQMLSDADQALYQAKKKGRNRVNAVG